MLCSKKCGQAAILARVKPPPLGPAGRLVGLVGHERSAMDDIIIPTSHTLWCVRKSCRAGWLRPSWLDCCLALVPLLFWPARVSFQKVSGVLGTVRCAQDTVSKDYILVVVGVCSTAHTFSWAKLGCGNFWQFPKKQCWKSPELTYLEHP